MDLQLLSLVTYNVVRITVMISVYFVLYHWCRYYLNLMSLRYPGPPALPFVGNGLHFLCDKKEILNVLMRITRPYSSPLRLWFGPKFVIFVKDPSQFQTIMQSAKLTDKSFIYKFLEPFFGKGLFTSKGNAHKKHRRLLQPVFSQKMLEGYSYLFQKHATRLVDKVGSCEKPEVTFNVHPYVQDISLEASMDIFLEEKSERFIDYAFMSRCMKKFYEIFFTRVMTFWLHSEYIFSMTSMYKEQQEMKNLAKVVTEEMLEVKIPETLDRMQKNTTIAEELRTPSLVETLIQMVIEEPDCLTKEECVDHLMTFVGTSHDTQSSAIAFTLMMLAIHKDNQAKLFEELQSVCGDQKTINYVDMPKLQYLDMCVKEALRLFPPGPYLFRDAIEDFQLGKYHVPRGTTIMLGLFNVHRSSDYWEKPNEFYPEHFLLEKVEKRHPYAFLPFSAGPRRCIAQQYTYLNLKTVIGTFLMHYALSSDQKMEDVKIMSDVSIRPLDGYLIKIQKRD